MAIFSKNKSSADKPLAGPGPSPVKSPDTAFIGTKLHIKGKLSGSGNLILMGRFEGEFDLAGEIVVAPSAQVTAEIKAVNVKVSGQVTGNMAVEDRIQLEKTAVASGRMVAKKLSISDGAMFNGEIEMKPGAQAASLPKGKEGGHEPKIDGAKEKKSKN